MEEVHKQAIKEDLISCEKVIGLKQVLKQAQRKALKVIYLAADVDRSVGEKVITAAKAHNIPVLPITSKRELGRLCGIEVGAACVGMYNKENRI